MVIVISNIPCLRVLVLVNVYLFKSHGFNDFTGGVIVIPFESARSKHYMSARAKFTRFVPIRLEFRAEIRSGYSDVTAELCRACSNSLV